MSSRIMSFGGGSLGSIASAQASVHSALHSLEQGVKKRQLEQCPRVFVTVSRQPGAGGVSFSHQLAARLNEREPADWSAWDKELVEKVSAEHGVKRSIVEMLEERSHSWLDEMLAGFSGSENGPHVAELRAYERIALTINALASAGHAIIVGRGGVFITAAMPKGIHLQLVAPIEQRVRHIAEVYQLSMPVAAVRVGELEHNQAAFFRRWWSRRTIAPQTFTMTLNAGQMSVEEMIETVLPLIRSRDAAVRSKSVVAV